jgi:hypothetical protein
MIVALVIVATPCASVGCVKLKKVSIVVDYKIKWE